MKISKFRNFEVERYHRRTSFCPRTFFFKHSSIGRGRRLSFLKRLCRIGSLELDSTLRCFMHGTIYCHTGYWCPPRVKSNCPVLHQELPYRRYSLCALEISQAANKLTTSRCTLTTSTNYCCTTSLLLRVYPRECISPTKLSLP